MARGAEFNPNRNPETRQRVRQGVPLVVFDRTQGMSALTQYAKEAEIIPNCKDNPAFASFIQKAEATPAPHRPSEEDNDAREAIYQSLRKFYDLTPQDEDPETFYQKQMLAADNQIEKMVMTLFPRREDLKGTNEARQPQDLLTTIHQLVSPETNRRLAFELGTRIPLALTQAEIDRHTKGGKERSKEVQILFNEKLFKGETTSEVVYAIHDNTTNKVHPAPGPMHPEPLRKDYISSVPRYGLPVEDLPYETHVKEHNYLVNNLPGVGKVQLTPRTKETASIKAVRKAIRRQVKKGAEDLSPDTTNIDPTNDVRDVVGMQFVVMEELSAIEKTSDKDSDRPTKNKVTTLIEKVKDTLIESYGKGNVRFEEKDSTSGEVFQGKDFKGKRLMVTFTDAHAPKCPIEMWFHGIEDDINNRYSVGKIDEKTGKPQDFSAHELMEVERAIITAPLIFPDKLYAPPRRSKVEPPPKIDWEKIKRQAYERISAELRGINKLSKEDGLAELRKKQQELQKRY